MKPSLRFLRQGGIYRSDVWKIKVKTIPPEGGVPPPVGRPRAPVKDATEGPRLNSSSAMSSAPAISCRVYLHSSSSVLPSGPAGGTAPSGAVLVSSLDDAVFRKNEFQSMAVAIHITADCGAVRFEQNTIRNSLWGCLLYSQRTAPSQLTVNDQNRAILAPVAEALSTDTNLLTKVTVTRPAVGIGQFHGGLISLETGALLPVRSLALQFSENSFETEFPSRTPNLSLILIADVKGTAATVMVTGNRMST